MSDYPEHDKLLAVSGESQAAGDFLSWLMDTKGFVLADYSEGGPRPIHIHRSVPDLLAEFFGIDQAVIERERRAMLAKLRQHREARDVA